MHYYSTIIKSIVPQHFHQGHKVKHATVNSYGCVTRTQSVPRCPKRPNPIWSGCNGGIPRVSLRRWHWLIWQTSLAHGEWGWIKTKRASRNEWELIAPSCGPAITRKAPRTGEANGANKSTGSQKRLMKTNGQLVNRLIHPACFPWPAACQL